MSEEDPFRYCVHCKTDCYVTEPEHTEDCPSVTGLWPVREQDMGPKCVHCGEGALGPMCCEDCSQPLNFGDFYVRREVDPGDTLLPDVEGAIFEILCVGCGAKAALA